MSKPRVGREFQHLEDLTFIEGSTGALAAVDFLKKLAHDTSTIALKWDGGIVVYWGRDEQGDFVLTGKNGWGKCKSKSVDQLAEFIMSTGKGEAWRADFADDMCKIFAILEQSTPHWFRGYAKGDVLWHPNASCRIENNEVLFTPNQVAYYASLDSSIGKQIAASQLGIAVHDMYLAFGSSHAEAPGLVTFLETEQVVLFSQTYVTNCATVDSNSIRSIKEKINLHAEHIDYVLEARTGLSDLKNIIYSYVNYLVKNDAYHQIEHMFDTWLSKASVSENKKEKIRAIQAESKGFDILFSVIKELSVLKESVIGLFDCNISREPELVRFKNVNEGYVCTESKIKLVPRTQWKPR